VTGSGHPTSGFVYKLVAREGASGTLEPVAKKSVDKISVGGRKWALRRRTPDGVAEAEVVGISRFPRADDAPGDEQSDRPLLVPLVRDGESVGREPLEAARERHLACRAELPPAAHQMSKGEPVIPTVYEGD
jgi:nicotinate phosphoribosyltransferase